LREISFEEHKKIELDILINFAEFCEKHSLNYFLAYGTLIGAVRHKRFIPWDDDIDVQMPRPDYEKFVKIYNSEKDCRYYHFIDPADEDAVHTMGKIVDKRTVKKEPGVKYHKSDSHGVDIDIFPIDGQPEDEKEYRRFYLKKEFMFKMYSFAVEDFSKRTIPQKLRGVLFYIIASQNGKNHYLEKAIKINEKYSFYQSKYVGSIIAKCNTIRDRVRVECYESYQLSEFEGYEFRIPVGYDEVLTKLYGEYMKLPPAEERITHHSNKVYWK